MAYPPPGPNYPYGGGAGVRIIVFIHLGFLVSFNYQPGFVSILKKTFKKVFHNWF